MHGMVPDETMEGGTTTWVAIQKEGTRVGGGCIYDGETMLRLPYLPSTWASCSFSTARVPNWCRFRMLDPLAEVRFLICRRLTWSNIYSGICMYMNIYSVLHTTSKDYSVQYPINSLP